MIGFEGRVRYADGSTATWQMPKGGALFGEYWDYRWRKWTEHQIADAERNLWKPMAEYVARRMVRDGKRPVEVKLVRFFYPMTPPGEPTRPHRFQEFEYYTLRVGPGVFDGVGS